MSTGAGDLAIENLERLSSELRKDLTSIEQMLAELEADGVVKRSKVQELAAILHILSESGGGATASDNIQNKETVLNAGHLAQKKLKGIVEQIDLENFHLGLGEDALQLYTGVRTRLMATLNAVELVTATWKRMAEDQANTKPVPSVRIQSSATAPGSRVALGSSAIIRSQELERQRIAREIHDGPAQAIANVVLRMDILAKIYEKDPSKVPAEISRMKEIAQGALDEIRGFIFDLRPMTLQDLGLVATIKRIVNSVKELSGIDARFVVEGEECPLGQLVSLAVFRIAQEALSNLKKYSKCTLAWVHLKYLHTKIVLVVEDNGEGFDVDVVSDPAKKYFSFGLLGMQERADDINAELEISSVPGQGTKVVLIVPTEDNPAMGVSVDDHVKRK